MCKLSRESPHASTSLDRPLALTLASTVHHQTDPVERPGDTTLLMFILFHKPPLHNSVSVKQDAEREWASGQKWLSFFED